MVTQGQNLEPMSGEAGEDAANEEHVKNPLVATVTCVTVEGLTDNSKEISKQQTEEETFVRETPPICVKLTVKVGPLEVKDLHYNMGMHLKELLRLAPRFKIEYAQGTGPKLLRCQKWQRFNPTVYGHLVIPFTFHKVHDLVTVADLLKEFKLQGREMNISLSADFTTCVQGHVKASEDYRRKREAYKKKKAASEATLKKRTAFANNVPPHATVELLKSSVSGVEQVLLPKRWDGTIKGYAELVFTTEKVCKDWKQRKTISIDSYDVSIEDASKETKSDDRIVYANHIPPYATVDLLGDLIPGPKITIPKYDNGRNRSYAILCFDTKTEAVNFLKKQKELAMGRRKILLEKVCMDSLEYGKQADTEIKTEPMDATEPGVSDKQTSSPAVGNSAGPSIKSAHAKSSSSPSVSKKTATKTLSVKEVSKSVASPGIKIVAKEVEKSQVAEAEGSNSSGNSKTSSFAREKQEEQMTEKSPERDSKTQVEDPEELTKNVGLDSNEEDLVAIMLEMQKKMNSMKKKLQSEFDHSSDEEDAGKPEVLEMETESGVESGPSQKSDGESLPISSQEVPPESSQEPEKEVQSGPSRERNEVPQSETSQQSDKKEQSGPSQEAESKKVGKPLCFELVIDTSVQEPVKKKPRIEVEVKTVDTGSTAKEKKQLNWPKDGMECLVDACGSKRYNTYRQFMRHWNEIHVANKCKYFCTVPGCKVFKMHRNELGRHIRDAHGHSVEEAREAASSCIVELNVKNKHYISPGDKRPPVYGEKSSEKDSEPVVASADIIIIN